MPPSPSPRARERSASLLAASASWALAAVGALCLALTAGALLTGTRPLVIRTGSMAPHMPAGTVAIVRPQPASAVRVGDVVAVRRADGMRIMHRVRSARAAGGDAMTLVLRGDRNRAADPALTVQRVERPVLSIPRAGMPLTWLSGRWAQYWMGVATGALALAWVAIRRRRAAPAAAAQGALRA